MHLKLTMPAIAVMLALGVGGAAAQSLSPMRNAGDTPTLVKGFRLVVGNPYKTRMTFDIVPMEPGFAKRAADAEVNFQRITMAPGTSRQVIVTFRIDPAIKERTIGVCVQPKEIAGMVMPRVCGTYIGRLRG